MRRRSFAKRRDANEPDIVKALRDIGATVIPLDVFDLLVGYRGRNVMIEVKDPNASNGMNRRKSGEMALTEKQRDLIATWQGAPLHVVTTVDEAIAAVVTGNEGRD